MNFQDKERSQLRALIADIERELPTLTDLFTTRGQVTSGTRLLDSFSELVRLLALGPEPEVRHCPFCNGTIQRDATRCMHCWKESSRPAQESVGASD